MLILDPHALFVVCAQNGTNGMNGMSAQLNGLNAAALALQALAAANPALLLNQNPWLAQHMQLLNGQAGQGGAAMSQNAFAAGMHAQHQGSIPLEAAQFAAQHLAAGQHLNGGGECCMRAVTPDAGAAVCCPLLCFCICKGACAPRAPSSCAVFWIITTALICCCLLLPPPSLTPTTHLRHGWSHSAAQRPQPASAGWRRVHLCRPRGAAPGRKRLALQRRRG